MITIPALPSLGDLLSLAGRADQDDQRLAAPWLKDGDTAVLLGRSAWALYAIVKDWIDRHDGDIPTVWLPAYFCNQSAEPLRRLRPNLHFFEVDDDLNPDWEFCKNLAAKAKPDIFVLVHYFGQPRDAHGARSFCQKFGTWLVEDGAHVLRPAAGIGDFGDFVFYSPHKNLAMPDGSILIGRRGLIPKKIEGATTPVFPWLVKRSLQSFAPSRLLPPPTRGMPGRFDADPPACAMPEEQTVSDTGRKLLKRYGRQLDIIAKQRAFNAHKLAAALAHHEGWAPLFAPVAHTAPYRLVMRCDDEFIASRYYDTFRAKGFPIETWPDMPPEIRAEPERFPTALKLRSTLMGFPIHQSLDADELVRKAEA